MASNITLVDASLQCYIIANNHCLSLHLPPQVESIWKFRNMSTPSLKKPCGRVSGGSFISLYYSQWLAMVPNVCSFFYRYLHLFAQHRIELKVLLLLYLLFHCQVYKPDYLILVAWVASIMMLVKTFLLSFSNHLFLFFYYELRGTMGSNCSETNETVVLNFLLISR